MPLESHQLGFTRVLIASLVPSKCFFEKKYIDFEVSRYAKQSLAIETAPSKFIWLKMGISFGFFMSVFFLFQSHAYDNLSYEKIVKLGTVSLLSGAFFGGTMWFFLGRRKRKP